MSTGVLEVRSPFDQGVVAELPLDDERSIEEKIAASRAAFESWRELPLRERVRQVEAGLTAFRNKSESIARDVSRQMGKPIGEARREIETFFARARWALGAAEEALAPEVLSGQGGLHRRIEHVPAGVVLDIAAWNYPLLVPVNVLIPALLAGNSVLLKHSERTPLTGRALAEAFGSLDVPDLVVDVVVERDATARLIDDPRVAKVCFTGSVATGHKVYRRAAERLVDVGLELGGKDPAYVAADADLEFTAENVVDGACYNAGQSCCAVERVYVHRKVHDEFVERARGLLAAYELGDPLDEATTLGPLAMRQSVELVERQVADAVSRGARLVLGGQRVPGTKGNFFPATLVTDVPNDSALMQDESFAPIVPVRVVESDEEALALMRDTRFGLTASIWTADRGRAERFARDLEAGTVFQNRCNYLDPALPWTGFRDSGLGVSLSRYGFHALTRRKSLHFRTRTASR